MEVCALTYVLSASYNVLHVTGPDAHNRHEYSFIIALQVTHCTMTEIILY